jgi:segregation and condensation protein B
VTALAEKFNANGRAVSGEEVAGGYQLRTKSDLAPWIRKYLASRPVRLSRAALEVLAVVAYRQPITRHEIESIRGVDCSAVLQSLLERRLVKIMGRKDVPGRPIIYGTTRQFLEHFNLPDLTQLPTLREFAEPPGGHARPPDGTEDQEEGEGAMEAGAAGEGAAEDAGEESAGETSFTRGGAGAEAEDEAGFEPEEETDDEARGGAVFQEEDEDDGDEEVDPEELDLEDLDEEELDDEDDDEPDEY